MWCEGIKNYLWIIWQIMSKKEGGRRWKPREGGCCFAKTKINCTYSIMTTAFPERVERQIINKDVHGQRPRICLEVNGQWSGTPSLVHAKASNTLSITGTIKGTQAKIDISRCWVWSSVFITCTSNEQMACRAESSSRKDQFSLLSEPRTIRRSQEKTPHPSSKL